MNRKTILAFSIVSTVALVLLIAFAPMAETKHTPSGAATTVAAGRATTAAAGAGIMTGAGKTAYLFIF